MTQRELVRHNREIDAALSVEDVVKELYQGILQREPSPQFLREHSEQIRKEGKGGVSNAIRRFLASSEFRRRFSDPNNLAAKLLVNSSRVYLDQVDRQFGEQIPPGSLVLDVGAGSAPYKKYFAHTAYETCDFEQVDKAYAETTYVCDITAGIPVESGRFDFILFNQTLEHIKEPLKALNELNRVLKGGGKLLCTVPLFYEEHEQPHDFFRYTQFALRYLFEQAGFRIERLEWLEGFFGTCAYMMECIYKFSPDTVPTVTDESLWAKAFLGALKPMAFAAAGALYKMDLSWKITSVGFPKNYVVHAMKPTT